MSDKKSYNVLALRGQDVDDMEYVERYNLDPSIAYTPKINDVMLDKVYEENLELYRSEGLDEATAKQKAKRNRAEALTSIKKLMK